MLETIRLLLSSESLFSEQEENVKGGMKWGGNSILKCTHYYRNFLPNQEEDGDS